MTQIVKVRFEPELLEDTDTAASECGLNRSSFVRSAVVQKLRELGKARPRKKTSNSRPVRRVAQPPP